MARLWYNIYLHNIGFVPLQDLDGLGGVGVDDEDAGVAPLSNQPLPAPAEDRKIGRAACRERV